MNPPVIHLNIHTECGSGHLLLAEGGASARVERITASGLAVADSDMHLVGQGWADWEVRGGSVNGAFLWIADVITQLPLPLAARTRGYPVRRTRRDTELKWLEQHSRELRGLAGHWVAINGNELISHGRRPMEVLEAARQRGVDRPLMFHVPEAEAEISFAAFD